jgi:hypothetical protein
LASAAARLSIAPKQAVADEAVAAPVQWASPQASNRKEINRWEPRGFSATCEDLERSQSAGVRCWANRIDQDATAEVDGMRWQNISPWCH